jgi:opacity protein-like surface antigen
MKKIQLSILFFILITCQISAQRFDAGIVCGFAATQVDGDGNAGYNKAGPILGIWVGHRLTSVFYSRMELRYIQKGSYAKNVDETGSSSFYRMRLNYFEIPLILGYRLRNGFNPIAGLSGGYLAKAKEMNQYGSFPPEDIQKFHKFEFAGLIGLEYNRSEHWAFYGIYTYSIFPIRPHKGNVTYRWDRGQYNNVLELVARYKL